LGKFLDKLAKGNLKENFEKKEERKLFPKISMFKIFLIKWGKKTSLFSNLCWRKLFFNSFSSFSEYHLLKFLFQQK